MIGMNRAVTVLAKRPMVLALMIIGLAALACGPLGGGAAPTPTLFELPPPVTVTSIEGAPLPTEEPPLTEEVAGPTETPTTAVDTANLQLTTVFQLTDVASTAAAAAGSLSQWATVATASSQYGTDDWSASKATGEPDVYPECVDNVNAWATAGPGSANEFIQLVYATPVVPTRIDIYETLAAGSVVQVDVVDEAGEATEVFRIAPMQAECPRIFSIAVIGIDFKVNGVIVRLDQSLIGGYDEIDAVQLVGNP